MAIGTVSTAASYGLPPIAMQDMAAGVGPATHPFDRPFFKGGFSIYAILLVGVAVLYFWRGRK